MDIPTLFKLEIGETVRISNEPLTLAGRSTITFEGGDELVWLFDEDERILSIAPEEEELFLFEKIDEEIEPDEEGIFFQGKEYEFHYKDTGVVTDVEGDVITEPDDNYTYMDYQAKNGEVLRIVSNENTGEIGVYIGNTASEDDLSGV
jgi:hypothetical protein